MLNSVLTYCVVKNKCEKKLINYMNLLPIISVLIVFSFGSAYAQSVYDIGIDGEIVENCFKQIGKTVLIIDVSKNTKECLEVMDWFLQHRDYKHTGEIIDSKQHSFPNGWAYETHTKYLVLTKNFK